MELFVAHYSEVALKGKNRPEFVRSLRHNIFRGLADLSPKVSLKDGRFLVSIDGDPKVAEERLAKVFGIAWFSKVSAVPLEYSAISKEVLGQAMTSGQPSFRISPHRSDKTFPITSSQLAERLGDDVMRGTGKKVNLSEPGLDLHVDVIRGQALVYSNRQAGPGGLPVGTAGRVMHLFSGGIDSPVAAWLLMKRGCRPVYVHFYLAPTPDYPLRSKITELVRILSSFGGRSTLVLLPFAEYQLATSEVQGGIEPSLFRRFMRMTAETLAPRFRAGAVATGDSLSQAASQTLWNLAAFDDGARFPILRPLLTYDKDEIVSLARRIGTYEPSIEEYKDCCAIITKHPQTRAKPELITKLSQELGFDRLISRSIEGGTLVVQDPVKAGLRVKPLSDLLNEPLEGSAEAPPGTSATGAVEAKL